MGRGKVKLERIADNGRRTVCFSKRKSNLLKKARELAVLCDVEVAVVVFSPDGELNSFCSQPSMKETFQRYKRFLEAESNAMNHSLKQKVMRKDLVGRETDSIWREGNRHRFIDQSMSELRDLEEELVRQLLKVKSMKYELLKGATVGLD